MTLLELGTGPEQETLGQGSLEQGALEQGARGPRAEL